MATFQFSDHPGVDLDFCGKLSFRLPLDDETARRLKKAGEYLSEKSRVNDEQTLENLCDYVMDAIDDVLGEGAADQIAELKRDFNFWDALDVFQHISVEFSAAVGKESQRFKRPQPAAVPGNRAGRRAAARAAAKEKAAVPVIREA